MKLFFIIEQSSFVIEFCGAPDKMQLLADLLGSELT